MFKTSVIIPTKKTRCTRKNPDIRSQEVQWRRHKNSLAYDPYASTLNGTAPIKTDSGDKGSIAQ